MKNQASLLDKGSLTFSVEGRLLRELGERLVKQPEVAFVELIKNSYDADATLCEVKYDPDHSIVVSDTGTGMTFRQFSKSWMRIGTSSKQEKQSSAKFGRLITGDKGIGRFAVRFLGTHLSLSSVAADPDRGQKTRLVANFDWPEFDKNEDIGKVRVPYTLSAAADDETTGTVLTITRLRPQAREVDLGLVRTSSIGIVSPFRALFSDRYSGGSGRKRDPGFSLQIDRGNDEQGEDVASAVLAAGVIRAEIELVGKKVTVSIFSKKSQKAQLKISDTYPNSIGWMHADIRFFPDRKGTFTGLSVKGPAARTWIRANPGVAVFDRNFRVYPYGSVGDDWLGLAADNAVNIRTPRSTIAHKHFPMDDETRKSTQLNYMLRLPYPRQLIGVVQVEGRRARDQDESGLGLIPAADREGFLNNQTFDELYNLVRGAIEAIAYVDREIQVAEEDERNRLELKSLKHATQQTIRQIQQNPAIKADDKRRIVTQLTDVLGQSERQQERAQEAASRLEVMSLLGIVAGFMSHEFGTALDVMERGRTLLLKYAKQDAEIKEAADKLSRHVETLRDFVTYSQGYIQGAATTPLAPYPARPRIQQVLRVFGKYATDSKIQIDVDINTGLQAPLVPVSLYGGIALNLYTNALKAVMAKLGKGERRIAFRAWNEGRWHHLEVMDTGVGIANALRERVFDPLFTTTASNQDVLGSGMGLGLTLVKRATESYGGKVEVIDAPEEFATCVAVRLPLAGE